jgi:hypothetical protein
MNPYWWRERGIRKDRRGIWPGHAPATAQPGGRVSVDGSLRRK